MNNLDIDQVVWGYLSCALFTSETHDGDQYDSIYGVADFEDESFELARKLCVEFLEENLNDLEESGLFSYEIGMNIWFDSHGHGTGFWDRGLGKLGKRLSEMAKRCHAYECFNDEDEFEYGPTVFLV